MIRSRVPLGKPWVLGTKTTKSSQLLNGSKVAMFKKKDDDVVVVDKTCPHRGADLSCGIVKDDCLQCPYHGWLFDDKGKLVHVPTANRPPKKSNIRSYDIREKYDFVWYGDGDIPDVTEVTQLGWGQVTGSRLVKGNWVDWIGNSLDISHINFVHDFADEDDAAVRNMKIKETPTSTICEAFVTPKPVNLFTQHMKVDKCPVRVEFIYPNTTLIKIELKKPYKFTTFTSVMPVTPELTRLSWSFSHNMMVDPMIMNMINAEFGRQMDKTISEDEEIVSKIPPNFTWDVNVPCDIFQMKVVKRLNRMVEDNMENLFTLL